MTILLKKKLKLPIIFFGLVCSFLLGCEPINFFEKTKVFEKHKWYAKDTPSFTFQIKDTLRPYKFYLVLRHTNAYNYSNIWLNIVLKSPVDKDTVHRQFKLAEGDKGWLGTGMDDIYDQRLPINESAMILRKGFYTISLQQDMRENPLEHVLAVGVRLEKVE